MNNNKAVDHFLSEHFKSYVLIAYDYEGNSINFSHIMNQEEMDSMVTAIERTMQSFMNENCPPDDMSWKSISGDNDDDDDDE